MCGIAGGVGSTATDLVTLDRMAARMAHRGPDSQGVWTDAWAGLAVRRLAIIDLNRRSDQPLHLGPWHLVFNGEIYNYRELREELLRLGHHFVTEGDGEVLLHAWAEWEERALAAINGMFALAIWHEERRELTCARDPFGEKPLFWTSDDRGFVFASEIHALLAARPDLNRPRAEAVAPYLGSGLLPPVDQSFLTGIRRLPAAHLLRVRDGSIQVDRYWRPRRRDIPADFNEAAAELRGLLTDSIRLRLRSDVPVGTSLSGGIDSSAIACLGAVVAGDHQRHAFTARFPGFVRDEWRFAQSAARAASVVEHHSVEPDVSGLLKNLETLVRFQEEPFGSLSIYAQWCVMRAARDHGVTVLLDGQGADELFGGYPGARGWALMTGGPRRIVRGLMSSRDRTDLLRAVGSDFAPRAVVRAYHRHASTRYATDSVRAEAAKVFIETPPDSEFGSALSRELVRQSFYTSMPGLLRYADRNSMAHSREVRLPYLDRRVAEFALSVPSDFLFRGGVTKAVLREAVRGLAPEEVLARRDKIGYEPPQATWLREPAFVTRITDVLLDDVARRRGLYETAFIEADARAGVWRDPEGIWRALNLELWLRGVERGQDNA